MKDKKLRIEDALSATKAAVEEEGRWITLKVSAAGIKTINKKGLAVALREAAAPKKVY